MSRMPTTFLASRWSPCTRGRRCRCCRCPFPPWKPAPLIELGRSLAPLRDEGCLIVGSGFLTHNMHFVFTKRSVQYG